MRTLVTCICVAMAMGSMATAQQSNAPVGEAPAPETDLPKEEQHLRKGVMLLAALYDTLMKVQDQSSAQAAVPKIVRLTRELHAWGQGVTALPQLSEKEARTYESRYLPLINRVNEHLRAQGERLAAWEYYGSQDLEYALISLYTMAQQ